MTEKKHAAFKKNQSRSPSKSNFSAPQEVGKKGRKLLAGVKYAEDSSPEPKRYPGRPDANPKNG
jgi:hypothetical protein